MNIKQHSEIRVLFSCSEQAREPYVTRKRFTGYHDLAGALWGAWVRIFVQSN